MKNVVVSIFLLFAGAFFGWFAHDFSNQSEKKIDAALRKEALLSREKVAVIAIENPGTDSPVFLDQRLLSNPQLDKLIELFKLEMHVEDKAQLDRQLVQYAQILTARTEKPANIERQLLVLSNIESIQMQILPILIKFYETSGQNLAAIEQLYKLRSLVSFDEEYQNISQQIKKVTDEHVKRLMHANQKEKLTAFYEHMLAIEPDNYTLQMKFAQSEYDNKHYENALRLLSVLIYHSELDDQALQLLQKTQHKLKRLSRGDISISLVKQGEQYIVNAVINDREPVKLMLDTGASMTILSAEIMNSLGIAEDSIQQVLRFSTANGAVEAPVVVIDKIDVLQYSVSDLQVAILPTFPMGPIDGLLGMNFLSHFSFFIDQENLALQLSDKEE